MIFTFAFFVSLIFSWVAIKVARKAKLMDMPGSDRKVHKNPVPLLGGVAVFAAYAAALLLNFRFSWELKGIVIASFIIMLSGLMDDVMEGGLSATVRLIVQVVCSLIVVYFGVHLKIVPDSFPFSNYLDIIITVLWIVGITNAMNFMDGLDGLATGLTVIAAGAFCIVAYQTQQSYFMYLNIALCGACAGFLVLNFRPAKIFLGDAGSSFLGFTLAALAIKGEWAESRPVVALSIPVLILAVLIFDMIYISIARITQGKVKNFKEWLEYTGKDHLHHRLMGFGFTQAQAVLFVYLISMIFALGALVLKDAVAFQALLLIFQGALILVTVAILMLVGRENVQKKHIQTILAGEKQ
ncbi:MAG: MraY family glycosyltransferase [Candidatus Tantalella remota]|nr:MraY family glycosyltransferase [Candidatus Tantalella remota]